MGVQVAFIRDPIRKNGSIMHRIVGRPRVGFDKLINYMARATGLSGNDIKSIFDHFVEALMFFLPDGSRVETPIGTFSIGLRQEPGSETDIPDNVADRKIGTDGLFIRLRANNSVLARAKIVTSVDVVDAPNVKQPVVLQVQNTEGNRNLNQGSSGQVIHITGSRLSFSRTDEELGVFFIDDIADTETRAVNYSRIGSTFVDCKVPDLSPGTYTVEVRTRPTEKDVRSGVSETPFTVS